MIIVYLWYLVALLSSTVSVQGIYNAIETIAYIGNTTTVGCPGNEVFTLPKWSGPPVLTTGSLTPYTLENNNFITPSKPRISYAADQRSLLINNTELSDAGKYQCYKAQFPLTGENIVIVRARPDKLNITSSVPVNNNVVRAAEGRSLTVTCTSRGGFPAPTLAWYRSATGHRLANTSSGTQVGDTFNVELNYTFIPTRLDDNQQLVCRSFWPTPTDKYGSLEVALYLYLKPDKPSVTKTDTVISGVDVTLECRTSGCRPAATISWTYQGQTYTPNATVTNNTTTQTFTAVSVLRMPVTAADNGQTIVCKVSHIALDNDLTTSTSLNVQFPVGRSTTQISGNRLTVANGINQLSLNCTTGSSNPPAVITWRNGTEIISNNDAYTNHSGTNNGVVRSQTLILTPTRYDDRDSINCSATNDVNNVTDSTVVTLNIHFAPIITTSAQPTLTLTEQTSQPSTELPCSVESNPLSNITWYHNGRAVTSGYIGSSLSYIIRDANRTSYGNYTCTANNNVPPNVSTTYTVNVLFRPLEVRIDKPTSNVIANNQNTMYINCTSGTSNPVSEITWYTGNLQTGTPNHVDRPGMFGGMVLTSTIRFKPTREHDGMTVRCAARNNVTGQYEIANSTVVNNILYSPLIVNIPAKDVVEGDNVTLSCHASSKPPASFTWRKGPDIVAIGNGTITYNGLNYTINNTSRTQDGTYNCTADNQVPPSGLEQTVLRVLYPPSITVFAINTTVNNSGTNVTCNALGVPDQYTYERWVHTWNGHVVIHPEPLAAERVLTLTGLSYEHSGVYKCGASNGVKGFSRGAGSLLVKSPPIIVGDVANTLEIKASGQLMKTTTVTFQYFSNNGRGVVTIQKTNSTGDNVGDVELRDVDIILPMFLSKIKTTGTEATINITVNSMNLFGDYDIFVTNEIMDSVRLSAIIKPHGPPEPPVLVNSTILDHRSVTIVWIPGFPNGFNQTFVIQLTTDNSTWRNITQYGGMVYKHAQAKIIDSLTGNQLYYVRMLAINALGESGFSNTVDFKTAVSPDQPTSSPVSLIAGGSVAGLVTAAVTIAVFFVILRRRKAASTPGDAKDKGALVMSRNHIEGYDDGDMEVVNRLYESAGPCETETVVGSPISTQVPSVDVDNIYAKVNKKPDVVYAMPDKRKGGKKVERKQNQKTMKPQTDGKKKNDKHMNKNQTGDIYENAPNLTSKNKSAPQSGESVYEDTCTSALTLQKKPMGTDGLLYADLEFAPVKKGQTKIIGIEEKCEYTTIDLTKKAQPLPDSDDENKTNQ